MVLLVYVCWLDTNLFDNEFIAIDDLLKATAAEAIYRITR